MGSGSQTGGRPRWYKRYQRTADAVRSIRSVAAWNIIESTSHGLTCSILRVLKRLVSTLSHALLFVTSQTSISFLSSNGPPSFELIHKACSCVKKRTKYIKHNGHAHTPSAMHARTQPAITHARTQPAVTHACMHACVLSKFLNQFTKSLKIVKIRTYRTSL